MPENLRIATRYGQPVLPLLDRAHEATCGGPMPKLVYLVMVALARRSGVCWASVATITRHAEASRRTVQRALGALALGGRIEAEGGRSRGRRTSFYRLVDVEPRHSDAVEPRHSDAVVPRHSDAVEPRHSDAVEPRHSDAVVPRHSDAVEPRHSDAVEPRHSDAVVPRHSDAVGTPYGVTAAARDAVREAAARAELAKPRPAGRSSVGASRPVSNAGAGRRLRSGSVPSAEATARMLAAQRAERRRLWELRHEPEG